MQDKLIARAKELLAEGKVQKVVGWKKGLFDEDITPAVFTSAEELDKDFVFNKYCKANLSKYLVGITREIEVKKSTTRMNNTMAKQRDPNAQDAPIPQEVVLVFLKPSDTYSFTQLLKENRITRADVYAIGVPCQDTIDGGELCDNCKGKKHVSCDELIGVDEGAEVTPNTKRLEEVAKLEAMTSEQRYEFWRNEFSRCIRCNACRNVCPACTCEKCVFDNNKLYTSQKVAQSSFEENLFHIIRAWHVAGRCTDCGECSRVCPQNIPLYLLNRKFIKDINEIYGDYQAGSDMESKPAMLTFNADSDPETTIVWDRSSEKEAE
ncbi:4Fe-4S dicluster domain-containing protein [Treponema sp.]|uniref:4Fe-4S dicluster domain-containing protein n=1 Tax=Treponema sp. TaxID=166 RepID=UPI00298EB739|nr:4Fe-4S dicluster domain-containing protein [Treponema sp.]MCR5612632.1 4Fe-4S dicluster domain-containing protein [Treponema sp.]